MSPTSKYSPITARKALLDACKRTKSGSRYVEVPANVLSECVILFSSLEAQLAEATARATKAETRLSEAQAELAEQETAALQWARTLAEYNNELSRLRAANENAEQRKLLLHEALLIAMNGLEWCYDVCDYPADGASQQAKALENAKHILAQVVALEMPAPTPPPSSPAAAGSGDSERWIPVTERLPVDFDEDGLSCRKMLVCHAGECSTEPVLFSKRGNWLRAGHYGNPAPVSHWREYPDGPAATPTGEPWRAVFPTEADYSDSVARNVERIKSGEVKPIEQEGDEREVIGTYETSGLPVYEGDDYVTDVEGCYLTRAEANELKADDELRAPTTTGEGKEVA